MPLTPATRLGPYEIIAALGAGGTGEVYRARDSRLGREIALKVLRAEMSANAERLARFEREACTVAGLNHPNIVTPFSARTPMASGSSPWSWSTAGCSLHGDPRWDALMRKIGKSHRPRCGPAVVQGEIAS